MQRSQCQPSTLLIAEGAFSIEIKLLAFVFPSSGISLVSPGSLVLKLRSWEHILYNNLLLVTVLLIALREAQVHNRLVMLWQGLIFTNELSEVFGCYSVYFLCSPTSAD